MIPLKRDFVSASWRILSLHDLSRFFIEKAGNNLPILSALAFRARFLSESTKSLFTFHIHLVAK
jgi:hypothetical protein